MKTFKCYACGKTFEVVKNLQPVLMAGGKMCQYCYASGTWGKTWADKCRKDEPRMNAVDGLTLTAPKVLTADDIERIGKNATKNGSNINHPKRY